MIEMKKLVISLCVLTIINFFYPKSFSAGTLIVVIRLIIETSALVIAIVLLSKHQQLK